jgi:hypothetical protein
MIQLRRTTITAKYLENEFTEEQKKEILEYDNTFLVPPEITNNNDKQTYRVGFLAEFTKRLYPDKSRTEIYNILEKKYQIFLSRRQIERHIKKFLEKRNIV